MSKSALYTILVLVCIVVGLAAVVWWVSSGAAEPSAAERSLIGQPDDSPFTDLAGQEITLDRYLGNYDYVVVTSWASWCPFCGDQLADLNDFAGRHPDRVAVLGINRSESTTQAERYLNTLSEMPHLNLVLDPDDRFFRDIEGYTIPETVLYDRRGEVVQHTHGVLSARELERWVGELGL